MQFLLSFFNRSSNSHSAYSQFLSIQGNNFLFLEYWRSAFHAHFSALYRLLPYSFATFKSFNLLLNRRNWIHLRICQRGSKAVLSQLASPPPFPAGCARRAGSSGTSGILITLPSPQPCTAGQNVRSNVARNLVTDCLGIDTSMPYICLI